MGAKVRLRPHRTRTAGACGALPSPHRLRLLVVACCSILALSACRKKPAAVAPARPDEFQMAEAMLQAGDYEGGAAAYQNYLDFQPGGDHRDQALFRLGLIYALAGEPKADSGSARDTLQQLVNLYPQSDLSPPAQLILRLMAEVETLQIAKRNADHQIQQLNNKLEKLKKIDLGTPPHK